MQNNGCNTDLMTEGLPATLPWMWLVLGRALARLRRIRAEVDAGGDERIELLALNGVPNFKSAPLVVGETAPGRADCGRGGRVVCES